MRILRITRRFGASRARYARPDTPERRAVDRIVRELADDRFPLPGPNDREELILPALRCMARPIPSAGLLVCYRVRDQIVTLEGVMPIG